VGGTPGNQAALRPLLFAARLIVAGLPDPPAYGQDHPSRVGEPVSRRVETPAGCRPGQPRIRNVLTVDVEEYFHPNAMDDAVDPPRWDDLPTRVEHSTHRVLDLLSEHGVRATFFVLGWVAERLPHLAVEIARRGHEVACHGYAHRLVY